MENRRGKEREKPGRATLKQENQREKGKKKKNGGKEIINKTITTTFSPIKRRAYRLLSGQYRNKNRTSEVHYHENLEN